MNKEKVKNKIKILADLFWQLFKIGLFTFGGGYAMISIINDICVEKKKWITDDELMNVVIIAESTPGPISINCASYVGYRQAGILGSFVATLGVVMPSFIIIYLISMFLDNLLEIKIIESAFKGIKCAVGILIINAGVNMIVKKAKKDKTSENEEEKNEGSGISIKSKKIFNTVIIIISTLVMLAVNIFSWNFSSIALIFISAVLSFSLFLIYSMVRNKKKKEDGK